MQDALVFRFCSPFTSVLLWLCCVALFANGSAITGTNFYRLKQMDIDNKSTHSEVRQLMFDFENGLSIYPNPATDLIYINAYEPGIIAKVNIIDVNGKTVLQTRNTSMGIDLGSIAKGSYLLQVELATGKASIFKIVKQ